MRWIPGDCPSEFRHPLSYYDLDLLSTMDLLEFIIDLEGCMEMGCFGYNHPCALDDTLSVAWDIVKERPLVHPEDPRFYMDTGLYEPSSRVSTRFGESTMSRDSRMSGMSSRFGGLTMHGDSSMSGQARRLYNSGRKGVDSGFSESYRDSRRGIPSWYTDYKETRRETRRSKRHSKRPDDPSRGSHSSPRTGNEQQRAPSSHVWSHGGGHSSHRFSNRNSQQGAASTFRKLDPYKALEVSRNAEKAQIKAARDRLAKQFHPDKWAAKSDAEKQSANRRMMEINRAWEILSDDNKRRLYDERGVTDENELFDQDYAGWGGGSRWGRGAWGGGGEGWQDEWKRAGQWNGGGRGPRRWQN